MDFQLSIVDQNENRISTKKSVLRGEFDPIVENILVLFLMTARRLKWRHLHAVRLGASI